MNRVLIVDDAHAWNKLLGWHLTACGFKVDSASSCEEALAKLRRSRPDCILLDFNLCDGTALTLCAALRLEAKTPLPPIVIISGNPAVEVLAYRDCMADKFMLKDKDTFKLLPAAISAAIEKCSSVSGKNSKEKGKNG